MTKVSFLPSDFKRVVAQSELILKNRYFEQNPFLNDDGSSLLARPGLKFLMNVGEGPVRGIYTAPGSFNGDLFVVSYDTLYRIDKYKNITPIVSDLFDPYRGVVNMTSTAPIGTTPEFLFIADGRNLFVYTDNQFAQGEITGTPANNDVVRMGSVYYKFTSGSVNAGTPAGTLANPWLIALGGSAEIAWTNFRDAINVQGIAGSQYSTATTSNTEVKPTALSSTTVKVQATAVGALGNGVVTTETGAAIAWTQGGTLTGGGTAGTRVVEVPDDVGIIDVATSNSFVICIPVQGEDRNGRFYWIEPGETVINPLNFATAESKPDEIFAVEVLGDQFWLPGAGSTEVWYVTTNPDAPMQRLQGVVFDRGTWEGTAVAVHESMIVCDAEGAVFLIRGGAPQRISTPAVQEEIRKSIQNQQNMTP